MNRKALLALTAALIIVGSANAQQQSPSLERHIEVTRQYVPEVEGARKIDFPPRMQDTVTIKPDIKYTITPTPWKSVFGTTPIAPVAISTAEYMPHRPVYFLLGGGYPAQSALDLYASFSRRGDVRAAVYVNHYGQWTNEETVQRFRDIATWTENVIGFYAGRDFKRRSLDFDLEWRLNFHNFFDSSAPQVSTWGFFYSTLCASLQFGDSFTDLSRFNYRFGVKGGMWGVNWYDMVESPHASAFADFGWSMGKGAMIVGVRSDWWQSYNDMDGYVALMPEYSLQTGKVSVTAGIKAYYNSFDLWHYEEGKLPYSSSGERLYLLPKVKASYRITDALVPYLNIDGDIGSGSFPALSELNPYNEGYYTERPKTAELRGGCGGDLFGWANYDVYAGYIVAEMPCFIQSRGEFYPRLVPVNLFYAGLGLDLRLPAGFGAEAGFRYNTYNTAGNFWSGSSGMVGVGIPEFTVSGALTYRYRGRLFVRVAAEVTGPRHFASVSDSFIRMPLSVNLNASVEYKTGPRFSIFVKGDNLLDQRLYRYLGYAGLGANVLAGVKILF